DGEIYKAQLGINCGRFPDATAVALAADPGRTGHVPTLIPFVLRDRVEIPEDLSGLCVHSQHVTARDVALAPGGAYVEHAVLDLRRRRKPVAGANRRLHCRVPWTEHIHDHIRLTVLPKALNRLSCFRLEREQKGARCGIHHSVCITDAPVTKHVAFARTAADQAGHVIRPEETSIGGIDSVDASARIGHGHRAVDDDWSGLVADAVDYAVLEEPSRGKRFDVGPVDLVQVREPGSGEIQIVERPVDHRWRRRRLCREWRSEPRERLLRQYRGS